MNVNMKHHVLKTDPATFAATIDGTKTFEIRNDDRGFEVGDRLDLRETLHSGQEMREQDKPLVYTGRAAIVIVTHKLVGYGLMPGWCCLSHEPLRPAETATEVSERVTARLEGIGEITRSEEFDIFDNAVLSDAIASAYSMCGQTSSDDPRNELALKHYRALLAEQLKRATA